LSVGICTGALLLFYALRLVLLQLPGPKRLYFHWKFHHAILDIKEVIRMGDTISGLYDHHKNGYDTRKHILFCFRHIDKIPSKGVWPDAREVLGELAYSQPVLADITWGVDVERRGQTVVESSSAPPGLR
jgi:hypothetical protein